MCPALLIRVAFPGSVYRGADLGQAEAFPSPARLHAAFVSAAAGGPYAEDDGGVLVATAEHERAVRWLEDHEPLGMLVPDARLNRYGAVRHRVRAAVDPKRGGYHRDETGFEPLSAVDGAVVYVWPAAGDDVVLALSEIADEITHVGRADSTTIIRVSVEDLDQSHAAFRALVPGRGPGEALRVAQPGRFEALAAAHRRGLKPSAHAPGKKSPQATDEPAESAGEHATKLRRFAPRSPDGAWPFSEVWLVPTDLAWPNWSIAPEQRVQTAVAVHRTLVRAIETDVPAFVTGRDGDGPSGGAGHLAIHFTPTSDPLPSLWLALPPDVSEADRSALLDALAQRPVVKVGNDRRRLGPPRIESALGFWPTASSVLATESPLVLDAPGVPRHGPWSLDDAVLCSLGYALRGPIEKDGFAWGTGWTFRQRLVEHLRSRGAEARAARVHGSASRYAHRARDGDLLVAADALVTLGDFNAGGRGLLAIGRSRHLGGGLLRPLRGVT